MDTIEGDNSKINMFMNCDEGFYNALIPCLNSIDHNSTKNIDLYFAGNLTTEAREIISNQFPRIHLVYIDVESFPDFYEEVTRLNVTTIFPQASLYRIIAPFIIKVDRLLYLDADTIVNGDIYELFSLPFSTSIAVVKEASDFVKNRKVGDKTLADYFYSGMILFNCTQIKDKYSLADLTASIAKTGTCLDYPDQDFLNYFYAEDKTLLPLRYNNASYRGNSVRKIGRDSLIYHYCGKIKPWQKRWVCPYPGKLYWKYAASHLGVFHSWSNRFQQKVFFILRLLSIGWFQLCKTLKHLTPLAENLRGYLDPLAA